MKQQQQQRSEGRHRQAEMDRIGFGTDEQPEKILGRFTGSLALKRPTMTPDAHQAEAGAFVKKPPIHPCLAQNTISTRTQWQSIWLNILSVKFTSAPFICSRFPSIQSPA